MKINYDEESDTMTISLRDVDIAESDELRPGFIVDFAMDGGPVRVEILDASKFIEKAREIQFAVGEYSE